MKHKWRRRRKTKKITDTTVTASQTWDKKSHNTIILTIDDRMTIDIPTATTKALSTKRSNSRSNRQERREWKRGSRR